MLNDATRGNMVYEIYKLWLDVIDESTLMEEYLREHDYSELILDEEKKERLLDSWSAWIFNKNPIILNKEFRRYSELISKALETGK